MSDPRDKKKLLGRIADSVIWHIPVRARALAPKWFASNHYKLYFGREIDWNNPVEWNEKIRWYQFYGDTSQWPLLADKYRVREYLDNAGYGDTLIPLLGKWERPEDINFDRLPNQFVLKTNNSSGSVYIVEDKRTCDRKALVTKIQNDLNDRFWLRHIEPHYRFIKPVIVAEEYVRNSDDKPGLADYKFYCFNGEPRYCDVISQRDFATHEVKALTYSLNWEVVDGIRQEEVDKESVGVPRPATFDRMLAFCRDMSRGYPFVRIDLYEADGKMYFGEFTLTPGGLTGYPLKPEFCLEMGHLMQLPK